MDTLRDTSQDTSIIAIEAEEVVLPGGELKKGPVYVSIVEDIITNITSTRPPTVKDVIKTHLLTSGFIDLHIHGLGGTNDVIDFWSNPEYTLSRLPMGGTTSCLATVVLPKSSSQPNTRGLFDKLKDFIGRTDTGGAVLEGINAEGPIVNDFGGLPESDRDIPETDFELLIDSIPSIKIMTISPHIEAKYNYKRLKLLIKKGIKPSLGHDKEASESEILDALRLSKEPMHITHLFNVCSFHHRLPGLVNIGLTSVYPNLPEYTDIIPPTVEVIGDFAHVHPLTLSVLLQARGYESICFITDSIYHSNQPGETINYNGRQLIVSSDCKTMLLKGTNTLAGSCVSMLDIFHNLVNKLNVPIPQAVRMLAENPAKVADLKGLGSIAINNRADLLLFDKDLTLTATMVAGNAVWKK